ncbi:MAG TPA: response regulator [Pirellulales bacterium]
MIVPPISILISDDDLAFRETLAEMFAPRGFRTILAGDGEQALDIVRSEEVHLVLTDLHMPRLDGLDFIREATTIRRPLPCILMSAGFDRSLMEQARQTAFSILPKPVRVRDVRGSVELALRTFYDWTADAS